MRPEMLCYRRPLTSAGYTEGWKRKRQLSTERPMYDMSYSNSRQASYLTHVTQRPEYETWVEQCHECLRVQGPPSTFGQGSASPLYCLLRLLETSARRVQ